MTTEWTCIAVIYIRVFLSMETFQRTCSVVLITCHDVYHQCALVFGLYSTAAVQLSAEKQRWPILRSTMMFITAGSCVE